MANFNSELLQAVKEAARTSVKYDNEDQFNEAVEKIFKRSLELLQEAAEKTTFIA